MFLAVYNTYCLTYIETTFNKGYKQGLLQKVKSWYQRYMTQWFHNVLYVCSEYKLK